MSEITDGGIRFLRLYRVECGVVVLATGYKNTRKTARKIFGDKVADRCRDFVGTERGE
ncbi:uncharacterized protein V1513DRAFT_425683 [Lipomyces chichibuensis]|uniref:uncharacterized protein n=1 Tax=Lipomyces chichibuensis TaxID=1546026 RepID=UPI0033441B39